MEKKGRLYDAGLRSIPQGKDLELFPGLTLRVPFGAAYARNEDGSMDLSMPRPSPKGYRDGPF